MSNDAKISAECLTPILCVRDRLWDWGNPPTFGGHAGTSPSRFGRFTQTWPPNTTKWGFGRLTPLDIRAQAWRSRRTRMEMSQRTFLFYAGRRIRFKFALPLVPAPGRNPL